MAFELYSGFRKKGSRGVTVRFKGSAAYFSSEFIRLASQVLQEKGSLGHGEPVRFVQFYFDPETREVGVKPIGSKGLTDDEVLARSGGEVRKIHGARASQVSIAGFRETYGIADGEKVVLARREITDSRLPEGHQEITLFAGKVPT